MQVLKNLHLSTITTHSLVSGILSNVKSLSGLFSTVSNNDKTIRNDKTFNKGFNFIKDRLYSSRMFVSYKLYN